MKHSFFDIAKYTIFALSIAACTSNNTKTDIIGNADTTMITDTSTKQQVPTIQTPIVTVFNSLNPSLETIIFAQKWNRWIVGNDLPHENFDSYEEYLEEEQKEASVNEANNHLEIKNTGTGGGHETIDFYAIESTNELTQYLLIRKSFSPESTDVTAEIITSDATQKITNRGNAFGKNTPRFSLFFNSSTNTDILDKHQVLFFDYSFDNSTKQLVVSTIENSMFDCNNTTNGLDIDKTTAQEICDILQQKNTKEVRYTWNNTTKIFELK